MNTSVGNALRRLAGFLGVLIGLGILSVSLWLLLADIGHPYNKAQGLWFLAAVPGVMFIVGAIGTARGSLTLLYFLFCINTVVTSMGIGAVYEQLVSAGAYPILLFPATLELCMFALFIANEKKRR